MVFNSDINFFDISISKMVGQISIKTRIGWISGFENKGRIFKIKFGKLSL